MAGIQANVRLSPEDDALLSKWAAELGMEKGALVKRLFQEICEAKREGRASFERLPMPSPADLQHLVPRIDRLTTELDRVLRQRDKRDAELARQARSDTLGISQARDAIVADVVAAMRDALETIHGELVRTREELMDLMGRLPQIDALYAKLEEVLEAARAPKVVKTYNIGLGDWSGGMLAMASVIGLILGMVAFTLIAAMLPEGWLQLPYANRALGGGDRAICRLVDYQYGTGLTNCRTTVAGRTVTVTATAPRAGGNGR